MLTRVKGIGNDLELDEGVGICGKGGQSVPAGVGQPTLLIDGLTVGGTAPRDADWRGDVLDFWFGLDPEHWWTADAAARRRDPRALPASSGREKRQLPA